MQTVIDILTDRLNTLDKEREELMVAIQRLKSHPQEEREIPAHWNGNKKYPQYIGAGAWVLPKGWQLVNGWPQEPIEQRRHWL